MAKSGTFNTIAQGTVFEIGGDYPVWVGPMRELYPGGGNIDLSEYSAGDIIHAGTPVIYNGPGKDVTIVEITDAENMKNVNGLVFNDVCVPENCISATCAVAYKGKIYANRANGGEGLPKSLKSVLPEITFIYEGEAPADPS